MGEFFLELLRVYGLAAVVLAASYAGMGLIIRSLWKRNREQSQMIEGGGAASKLDAVTAALAATRAELGPMRAAVERIPEIEELLVARYETRIAFLEGQVRDLLEENRELQKKWREQASVDLREILGHVNANREAVAAIASAMSDMKDLLRR